jgi:hypothetical protein
MLLSYSAAGAQVYELSLMEYGICNFILLLNLLLILFENIQCWCYEKLLLIVRLLVLGAASLLSTFVLISRPQRLALSSCHCQILSCYLCHYMSHMLAVEMLTAGSFLSGWLEYGISHFSPDVYWYPTSWCLLPLLYVDWYIFYVIHCMHS